ncbi:hypothetical protein [uncultured Endozoicomonas sp.]|uniref:hypothetical protein n=1 Tax=uncultured Endozoicomonas sp. TaxID=432652 RepID=UPI0026166778|nr:hypothetical protein [uncultured Endozoicomonas sp.]
MGRFSVNKSVNPKAELSGLDKNENKLPTKSSLNRKVSTITESIKKFITGRKHKSTGTDLGFSKRKIEAASDKNRIPKSKGDYRALADSIPGLYAHGTMPEHSPLPDVLPEGPWQPDIINPDYLDPEFATTEVIESGSEVGVVRDIASAPADSLNAPSGDIDIDGLLNPVDVGLDIGTSAISHAVTLGFKLHKLSRLHHRKQAFENSTKIVDQWKNKPNNEAGTISLEEMKDLSMMAKLSGEVSGTSNSDLVRSLLGENKCRYASGAQVFQMTSRLLKLVKGSDGNIEKQLNSWRNEYRERNARMSSLSKKEDNKELIKYAHQSKKMMKQLNDILKPLGARMDFSKPWKLGKSAMASRHKFVIDENKLYKYLASKNRLPEKKSVRDYILSFEDSAPILKEFSNYESRKYRHQKSQAQWTAASLTASFLPVLKVDYGIRAGREFKERHYRKTNNIILSKKLNKIKAFEATHKELLGKNPLLKDALLLTEDVIKTKQIRTDIKTAHATVQGGLDVGGAIAGSAASIAAPGVGSLATDVAFGIAKASVTVGSVIARKNTDQTTGLSGRIESQAYLALKHAFYKSPEDSEDRSAIQAITEQLFDITPSQVELLFKQDDKHDIVSSKSLIRLRFNNFKHGREDADAAEKKT